MYGQYHIWDDGKTSFLKSKSVVLRQLILSRDEVKKKEERLSRVNECHQAMLKYGLIAIKNLEMIEALDIDREFEAVSECLNELRAFFDKGLS